MKERGGLNPYTAEVTTEPAQSVGQVIQPCFVVSHCSAVWVERQESPITAFYFLSHQTETLDVLADVFMLCINYTQIIYFSPCSYLF